MTDNKAIIIGAVAIGAVMVFVLAKGAKAAPPPEGYCCPYCGECFATYEDLVAHVQSEHAGQRIPLEIEWS